MYSWVSSAYIWYWTPELLSKWDKGVVHRLKRRGPRTEPWGTPVRRWEQGEELEPIRTDWERLESYELSSKRAEEDIPKLRESRDKSMSWSIVSKVAERSRKMRAEIR